MAEHQERTHEKRQTSAHHQHQKNHEAVRFNLVESYSCLTRQEPPDNSAAVQRRNRDEVEGHQHQINGNARGTNRNHEFVVKPNGSERLEQERPENHLQEIGERSGRSRDRHGLKRIAEIPRINRHGLCPAKKQSAAPCKRAHEQKRAGHRNGADGINVRNRIDRHAAEHRGGRIPQPSCRPAMSGFMKRDRKDQRNGVDADGLNGVVERIHGVLRE